MTEQLDRTRQVTSVAVMLAAACLSACAVAHAQTPPSGSPPGGADAAVSEAATTTPVTVTYTGPPPYFFVRPPRTTAGLSPESVHRVFVRPPNQQAVVACYTAVLAQNPRARASVSVRLDIIAGGFGSIDSVRVAPANDGLRDCIRAALGRFEWPNPTGSAGSTRVDAQIDLAPTPPATAGHAH